MPTPERTLGQMILLALVACITVSAVYLYAFPQMNVVYAGVVLLHLVLGTLATILLLPYFARLVREGTWLSLCGWLLFFAGAGLGFWLVRTGALRSEWKWLYAHM